MIIVHPAKLGQQMQTLGVEPVLWMHTAYGLGTLVLVPAARDILGATHKSNTLGRT